jgi:exosortase A
MLFLFALLSFIVAFFWDTFSAMAAVWSNSENFSHGWLIAPISVWLIWQQWPSIKSIRWRVCAWGLAALGLCVAMWLAGELARVSVVKSVAVVLMVPSAVLLLAGWQVFKVIQFPLLFLLTMVPAGEGLTPLLMEQTSTVLVWAVQATGIPIFREGMHFTLPTGRWSVVEACSGLRYVIAAAILALLFVHLNFQSWRRKVLFVIACLALSVVANWARAYMIVIIGHLSQMRYGVGDDHVVYGWVFFGIVMTLIFWVGSKFGDKEPIKANVTRAISVVETPAAQSYPPRIAYFIVALVLLITLGNLPGSLRNYQPKPEVFDQLRNKLNYESLATFPLETGLLHPISSVKAQFPDDVLFEASYFARQDVNQEMLAYGQRLLPEISPRFVELENGQEATARLDVGLANRHLVKIGDEQYMLLHWYIVGKSSVGSPYAAKAVRLFNVVKGEGDHSFSVVLATKLQRSPSDALKKLENYVLTVNSAFKTISLK